MFKIGLKHVSPWDLKPKLSFPLSFTHGGEKNVLPEKNPQKNNNKTNPCLPHGIYIFLILKKKTIFCSLASHVKNYFFFLFFIFFLSFRDGKKIKELKQISLAKMSFSSVLKS